MSDRYSVAQLQNLIRDIADYPKPGILFKDITPLLATPKALASACEWMAEPFRQQTIHKVLAIESRGFFFGVGLAERLNAGFVPVRKKGKLPYATFSENYNLEYGSATLEVHTDSIKPGENVLIVDDVLATGGTLKAVQNLTQRLKGNLVGASVLIEIEFLKGRAMLETSADNTTKIHSLLRY